MSTHNICFYGEIWKIIEYSPLISDTLGIVLFAGSKVFVHSCAATPNYLLECLAKHGKNNNLKDVELIHIPTVGPAIYNNNEYEGESCS